MLRSHRCGAISYFRELYYFDSAVVRFSVEILFYYFLLSFKTSSETVQYFRFPPPSELIMACNEYIAMIKTTVKPQKNSLETV